MDGMKRENWVAVLEKLFVWSVLMLNINEKNGKRTIGNTQILLKIFN